MFIVRWATGSKKVRTLEEALDWKESLEYFEDFVEIYDIERDVIV